VYCKTVPGVRIPLSPQDRRAMKCFAYILKSEYDGTYYYGSTQNLNERLKIHNLGKSSYTKGKRPWRIHYYEEFARRSEAIRREKFFKSMEGYIFLKGRNII
jgi:putative endonuclease